MGRTVHVPAAPQRIISLVPSQTELLHDLGFGDRVVGITKFCIHPESWFRSKARVSGASSPAHPSKSLELKALRWTICFENIEHDECPTWSP